MRLAEHGRIPYATRMLTVVSVEQILSLSERIIPEDAKKQRRRKQAVFKTSVIALEFPVVLYFKVKKRVHSLLTDLWRIGSSPWRNARMRQWKSAGTVPIFVLFYHRIAPRHPNPWSMDFATFKEQVQWMQRRFDLISMQEVQQRVQSGFNDRPAVSITFDDGYSENCEEALPFLISQNIPVTYFVTTNHITETTPFPHDVQRGTELPVNTIESLRALANANVEIAAHTRNHPDLGSLSDAAEIFDEVITATRDLENLIDRQIRYFAFPFGQPENLQANIFHLLKQHNFDGVCSAYGGWNEIGGDSFHIQRIHGDPNFARMQNWLTYDPRIANVARFDYSGGQSEIDWRQYQQAVGNQNEDAACAPANTLGVES